MLEPISLYRNIITKINECITDEKNVIYVVKGFDTFSFSNDFCIKKLYSVDLINLYQFDFKEQLPSILQKLSSKDSFVISIEEFLLNQSFLSQMYKLYNYRIVIIENDLFRNYYPVPSFLNNYNLGDGLDSEEGQYAAFYDGERLLGGGRFLRNK